jgi:hypothetical protein
MNVQTFRPSAKASMLVAAVGLVSMVFVSTVAVAEKDGDPPKPAPESQQKDQSADAGDQALGDRKGEDAGAPTMPSAESDESDKSDNDRILVDYTGRLEDQSGAAISGIFHFSFNLYSDSKSAEPLWSETRYVSVVDGSYTVPLGKTTELQREHISGPRWIGVELVGEGEILRDKLTIQSGTAGGDDTSDRALSEKTKRWLNEAAENSDMTFAEVAKRAVFADRADSAEKVGSLSAEEIERLSNLAMERLGEHIADPDAHGATGRSLGDQTRVMKQVGGSGGSAYRSECPPGFVVTGIKGGSGDMLDSIAIICRRLQ